MTIAIVPRRSRTIPTLRKVRSFLSGWIRAGEPAGLMRAKIRPPHTCILEDGAHVLQTRIRISARAVLYDSILVPSEALGTLGRIDDCRLRRRNSPLAGHLPVSFCVPRES